LSTHLRLGLPSGSFLLAFPPISYMHSSSPHARYMPRPYHSSWLDLSNYSWRRVQVMKYFTILYYFICLFCIDVNLCLSS
jgi:hypothetical protein